MSGRQHRHDTPKARQRFVSSQLLGPFVVLRVAWQILLAGATMLEPAIC